ncbi:kinesin-like protein KIN-14A [Durio zibethinus]|uniref:Kinesin-like protein KIN-14A n=1 Tax=Durio zibethinus TaxID=66656 RepID=A0A6P6BD56_DURZI|nr:kinesin-like protein KIN-14A [Durio zibethinus]
MGEQKSNNNNRWNWEVSGFKPRRSSPSSQEEQHRASAAPFMRRYSISAVSSESRYCLEFSEQALASEVQRLKDKVKIRRKIGFGL